MSEAKFTAPLASETKDGLKFFLLLRGCLKNKTDIRKMD